MTTKVAIYARVSTQDQDPGLQLSELRRYIQDRGWAVYQEYVDIGQLGAKDLRPELNELVAYNQDRELEEKVKRIVTLLEPLLILFMGLVIGVIVVSLLSSIFSLTESI